MRPTKRWLRSSDSFNQRQGKRCPKSQPVGDNVAACNSRKNNTMKATQNSTTWAKASGSTISRGTS